MADILEFLESLDNKELRTKCIEYNLPNIPVTNTSRSLLIRKLKEAITGEKDTKKKTKKPRETVHQETPTIVLDDDDDDDTHAPPEKLYQTYPKTSSSKRQHSKKTQNKKDESDANETTSSAISNVKHRANATTISSKTIPENKNNAIHLNYPYDLRSSPANSSRSSSMNDSGSKSSVTLSRSGISTTSYSVHIEGKPSKNIDELEDEDMCIDEGEFEIENSETNNNKYEYYNDNPTSYNLNVSKNYAQNSNSCLKKNSLKQLNIPPKVSFSEPEQRKMTYESSATNLSYKQPSYGTLQADGNDSVSFSEPEPRKMTYESSSGTNLSYKRPSYENLQADANESFSFPKKTIIHNVEIEKPSLYPFQMLNSAAEGMSSSMGSMYTPLASGSSLKMNQRKSTSSISSSLPYQRTPFNKSSTYKSSYGYNDEEETGTGSGSSHSESEYDESSVSNEEKLKTKDFSRTLNLHSTPNSTLKSTYGRSHLARRSLRPENPPSIMASFNNMLYALEHKYKVFTFIGWSAAIVIIIFFIVLFFF